MLAMFSILVCHGSKEVSFSKLFKRVENLRELAMQFAHTQDVSTVMCRLAIVGAPLFFPCGYPTAQRRREKKKLIMIFASLAQTENCEDLLLFLKGVPLTCQNC